MKRYTIIEGGHYSAHLPKFYWNKKRLVFDFLFSENCLYTLPTEDSYDVNKLYGLSFGHHMNNSWRLGFNCEKNDGTIQLFSYSHINKKVISEFLFSINPLSHYTACCVFDRLANKIWFNIKGENSLFYEKCISFNFNNASKFSYLLFPYFGGNQTTPNDMDIYINHLM